MKIASPAIFALLLIGCVSSRQSAMLTAEQAKTAAIQLSNDKASALYQCRPFRDGEPACLVAGRWVWTERTGMGRTDMEATVELAPDGSTNHVSVQLLDNMNSISFRF